MGSPSKVLVLGPADGQLRSYFSKLTSINSKNGPFSFSLLAGDLFAKEETENDGKEKKQGNDELDDLLAGKIQVPVTCYFGFGGHELPRKVREKLNGNEGNEGTAEICTNLVFIGKSSLFTTASGIRIATLGGCFDLENFTWSDSVSQEDKGAKEEEKEKDENQDADGDSNLKDGVDQPSASTATTTAKTIDPLSQPHFTSSSLSSLISLLSPPSSTPSSPSPPPSNPPIDILLTHSFPTQIFSLTNKPLPSSSSSSPPQSWGSPPITNLTKIAQPKYHFVSEKNTFWEREPFLWPLTSSSSTSTSTSSNQPKTHAEAKAAAATATKSGGDTSNSNERQPYPRSTRFISLGTFGNPNKQRWFYAFSITPSSKDNDDDSRGVVPPTGATPCPFYMGGGGGGGDGKRGIKRGLGEVEDEERTGNFIWGDGGAGRGGKKIKTGEPPSNYICRICNVGGHWIDNCPQKIDRPPNRNANGGIGGGGGAGGGGDGGMNGHGFGHSSGPGQNGGRRPPPDHYVCKICNTPGHWIQDCPEKGSERDERSSRRGFGPGASGKEIGPDECWFCLSNPKLTKHLITSIGNETYMTLPKGQIPPTNNPSACPVPGGGHVLIIPIAHYPTLKSLPSEISVPVVSEIETFKSSLRSLYRSYSSSLLSFEVARLTGKGGHAHVQIVPIPNEYIDKVEQAFREEGDKVGVEWEDEENGKKALEGKKGIENYFKVELPDGKIMVHIIKPGRPFNLQFGRATLVSMLGLPERLDWKACAQSDAEEKADAAAFKKAFATFAPRF